MLNGVLLIRLLVIITPAWPLLFDLSLLVTCTWKKQDWGGK